ncbi:DL-endopeptidase inhibitor IseA family protein [Sporosalibacterium faouarense]|uniref:DL-endopeptidase inhibitor IseA family protein n=1 Tax=Sporosalibacterium faouarense TaxID=516123 RepID=UPI00192C5A28|nr:DL-endopeptidase inhibitor IseA family protein [Sporosalibacterium faouarense]
MKVSSKLNLLFLLIPLILIGCNSTETVSIEKYSSLQNEINLLDNQRDKLNNELSTSKALTNELKREIDNLKDRITELENKNLSLEERNSKLESENKSLSIAISSSGKSQQNDIVILTHKDAEAIFQRAQEMLSLFRISSLRHDWNTALKHGDQTYYLVTDEDFKTKDDLNKKLSTIFTGSLYEDLVSLPKYISIDGRLYTYGGEAGSDPALGHVDIVYDHTDSKNLEVYYKVNTYDTENNLISSHDYILKYVDNSWLVKYCVFIS